MKPGSLKCGERKSVTVLSPSGNLFTYSLTLAKSGGSKGGGALELGDGYPDLPEDSAKHNANGDGDVVSVAPVHDFAPRVADHGTEPRSAFSDRADVPMPRLAVAAVDNIHEQAADLHRPPRPRPRWTWQPEFDDPL